MEIRTINEVSVNINRAEGGGYFISVTSRADSAARDQMRIFAKAARSSGLPLSTVGLFGRMHIDANDQKSLRPILVAAGLSKQAQREFFVKFSKEDTYERI